MNDLDAKKYMRTVKKVFAFNGLVVLRANDDKTPIQHGWENLYKDLKILKIYKKYKSIQGIRKMSEKKFNKTKNHKTIYDHRLFLYELGIIQEVDVYAWFYDLVWRQNNNAVLIETKEGFKKAIEDFSGRWNKKRPFGYQVRKRLKGALVELENPVMLTLTLSDERIFPLMPYNTNLDVVIFSISKIGQWIRQFNQRYYRYMQRNKIDWRFVGWVIEFQEKNNCGFPHVHMIFDGKWVGHIKDIEKLWGLGKVEITTKKDVKKKFPDRPLSNLRLANYLTKYVSKAGQAITEKGIHKGYAWLAFAGGRIFSVKHERKKT